MFYAITNIYNKKTKGPTLIKFFTATGKIKTIFGQLDMFDVCTTGDTSNNSSCKKETFLFFLWLRTIPLR